MEQNVWNYGVEFGGLPGDTFLCRNGGRGSIRDRFGFFLLKEWALPAAAPLSIALADMGTVLAFHCMALEAQTLNPRPYALNKSNLNKERLVPQMPLPESISPPPQPLLVLD